MTPTSLWHSCAAIAAFTLVLAGCQPDDPYQDAQELPTSAERASDDTAAIESIGSADTRDGTVSTLPMDERARRMEGDNWTDATEADYRTALRDCDRLGGEMREDCIAQVEIGFRAAQMEAQNPEEARQHPVPRSGEHAATTADASDEDAPSLRDDDTD